MSDAHRILLRAEIVMGDPAAGAHERAVGHTIEVSVTGAFIEIDRRPPVNDRVAVRLSFPRFSTRSSGRRAS